MTDWLAAVLLGIIEGLTEFLPISSTGHLLIAQRWLPAQSELFDVVIQSGAVLAVVVVFSKRLKEMFLSWREPKNFDYLIKLAFAFAVTGAGGLALKYKGLTFPKEIAPIAWTTLIGGIVILGLEYGMRNKKSAGEITWLVALTVGAAQILAAACPGTSRSGASILFAMVVGLSRPAATEFSFLVGIPTMFAAGGYEIYHTLKHADPGAQPERWDLVFIGTLVSALVAFVVVKWLLRYVQSHTFTGFGWYRIAVGAALLALVFHHVV